MYSKEQFPNKFSKHVWSSHDIPGTQYPKLFTVCEPKKILVHETDQACLRAHLPHVGVEHGRGPQRRSSASLENPEFFDCPEPYSADVMLSESS